MTRGSELVGEAEALDPCPGWRARRVMARALLPFLDSVALVVSLRDVLHCRSSFYAWFRSRSSLLTPPRAATSWLFRLVAALMRIFREKAIPSYLPFLLSPSGAANACPTSPDPF